MAGINVGGIYSELVLKADKFYTGLKQAQNDTSNFENKLKGMSNKATSAGKTLTTKLTAPIVGVGTAATLLGINFDASMSEVQAISGATGQDMEKLEELARKMGAETVFSASEAADALGMMGLAGWDTQQMMAGLEPVLLLAGAAGLELEESARYVTNTIGQFGLEAEDATRVTDVLAYTQANAQTDVRDLGHALEYAGVGAAAMGYDIEETSAILGVFAEAGLVGSKAGTTLNAMFRDMKDKAENGAIAIGDTRVEIVDSNGEYRKYTDILTDVNKATEHMTTAEKDAALMKIFGSQAMAGMNIVTGEGTDKLIEFEKSVRDADGASKDMYDTMQNNLKGSIDNIKSALEEAGLKIYNVMLPSLQGLADKIQNALDWFNGLDESTQRNIVVMGGLAAAIGPVLMVVGSLSGAILKTVGVAKMLSGGFAALSGASTVAGTAIGGTVAPSWALGGAMKAGAALMNPWVLGAAAVAGGAYLIHKRLSEDAIPAVERFDDTVSESTQEVVGNFMNMTEEANAQLKELSWGQQVVTAEMAEDMREKQQEITDTLLTAINERHQEEIESTKEQFENIEVLDAEQKAKILERLDERFEEQQAKTKEGYERINEIISEAEKKGREITAEEAAEIERIRSETTDTAIQIMTENEREQKVIYEKMKDNASTLSAQEAAEVVKNSKKKKDDVVKEAEEQYNETHAWAIQQRDELGTITKAEAKEIIDAAKKKRDETVENAKDTHEKVIQEAKAQAKEHVAEVNWETGEVKTKYQVMKDKVVGWFKKTREGAVKESERQKEEVAQRNEEARQRVTDIFKRMREGVVKESERQRNEVAQRNEEARERVVNAFRKMREGAAEQARRQSEEVSRRNEEARNRVSKAWESLSSSAGSTWSKISDSIQKGIDKVGQWNRTEAKNKTVTFTQRIKTMGDKILNGLKFGNQAHGTNYWRGGLTWVGEQGRELIDLPRGSKVYSNPKSEKIAQPAGGPLDLRVEVPVKLEGREIARATVAFTAEELQKLQARQRRGRG